MGVKWIKAQVHMANGPANWIKAPSVPMGLLHGPLRGSSVRAPECDATLYHTK